jgi:tyrosine-protein kinase Etk/Wzc
MATKETTAQDKVAVSMEEDGIDLFDLLIVLSEARKKIAVIVLISMILGAIISFLIKPTFTASALILPPQQGQSLSSMMGQLGSLISLSGAAMKTPADMYVGILESRTIADHLIERFHLRNSYKSKKIEDTRTRLKSNTRFLATKDGLIHITVDDGDPNRASEMANAYVDELYKMNSHLAITEAAQRRLFFDEELADEKNALTAAENDLRLSEEKTGVIQLPGQAESIIRGIAELRAEIASREVQIQSIRTFATDQNPDAIRAQGEINSLRDQLAQLEKDPRNPQPGATGLLAGRVPSISLEYARKLREVKYHESLFELLSKQYEAARIDEAKAAPVVQVVDRAVPPERKSGPHRTIVTLGFGFVGFCLVCIWVVIAKVFRRMEQAPAYAFKLARLRNRRA